MGTAFVEGVTSLLSGIVGWFTSVFNAIGGILYTAPTAPEGTGELTVIGWITCITLGLGIVSFGFNMLMKLVHRIRAKN